MPALARLHVHTLDDLGRMDALGRQTLAQQPEAEGLDLPRLDVNVRVLYVCAGGVMCVAVL